MPFPNEETQFKPGQTGNPNGSSRKQRFTSALVKLLDDGNLDDPFVQAGITAALGGDFNFWRYLYERIEGKIPDQEPQGEVSMEAGVSKIKEKLAKQRAKKKPEE